MYQYIYRPKSKPLRNILSRIAYKSRVSNLFNPLLECSLTNKTLCNTKPVIDLFFLFCAEPSVINKPINYLFLIKFTYKEILPPRIATKCVYFENV